MRTIEITDSNDGRMEAYIRLTEAQLRACKEGEMGIFIAESPKVIKMALSHGYRPLSLLCEHRHIGGDAADIIATMESLDPDIPVYTGSREILGSITGYTLTRGVLCAMERKPLPTLEETCRGARLVGVMQSITDTTNVGSIFRAASALGVDSLVISDDNCDPLNRRAIRVSMGTVFSVPWTSVSDPVSALKAAGFTTAALALHDNSTTLDDPRLKACRRLAVVFGTEGDGLPDKTIHACDFAVKIPMHHGVDSLNVASAAALTFWELRQR